MKACEKRPQADQTGFEREREGRGGGGENREGERERVRETQPHAKSLPAP